MDGKFKALIGLGNPGKLYENTYHNTGLIALRHLAEKIKADGADSQKVIRKKKFGYRQINGIFFIESLTYMNETGEAVGAALRHLKLGPKEILVLQDDSDLSIGQWKISTDRGSAGHKGIDSVMQALKTKKFTRLRIGIRPNPDDRLVKAGRTKAGNFVLKKIASSDNKILEKVFDEIAEKLFYLAAASGL